MVMTRKPLLKWFDMSRSSWISLDPLACFSTGSQVRRSVELQQQCPLTTTPLELLSALSRITLDKNRNNASNASCKCLLCRLDDRQLQLLLRVTSA